MTSTTGAVLLAPSGTDWSTYNAMYYLKGAAAGGICCSVTHGALTPVDVVKTRVQLDSVKVRFLGFPSPSGGEKREGGGKGRPAPREGHDPSWEIRPHSPPVTTLRSLSFGRSLLVPSDHDNN